jgi:hypothetical protein
MAAKNPTPLTWIKREGPIPWRSDDQRRNRPQQSTQVNGVPWHSVVPEQKAAFRLGGFVLLFCG